MAADAFREDFRQRIRVPFAETIQFRQHKAETKINDLHGVSVRPVRKWLGHHANSQIGASIRFAGILAAAGL